MNMVGKEGKRCQVQYFSQKIRSAIIKEIIMQQEIKLEIIPYPIKFMFGGFFVILGSMGLLILMIVIASHPDRLGSEIKNLLFGNFKTTSSTLSLAAVLAMAIFYIKNTSLKILQNQLVFVSPMVVGWRLDISQITKVAYSLTPTKQKFTLTVGQTDYTIPFRVFDPNSFIQSLRQMNPNIQVVTF